MKELIALPPWKTFILRKLQVIKWKSPFVYPFAFCKISYERWHCITRCLLLACLFDLLGENLLLSVHFAFFIQYLHLSLRMRSVVFSRFLVFDFNLKPFDFDWRSVFFSLFFRMRKSPWNIENLSLYDIQFEIRNYIKK